MQKHTKKAKKKRVGKKSALLLLLLLCERGEQEKREEEWGRGGRVSTSRNSNVWHPCSLRGGRSDTKPVRRSKSRKRWKGQRGEERRRGGQRTQPWGKTMHKSGISSSPPGTNNIVCWVNGSWWSQARGKSDGEAGRAPPGLLLSTNPQPWHDCRERLRDLFQSFIFFLAPFGL